MKNSTWGVSSQSVAQPGTHPYHSHNWLLHLAGPIGKSMERGVSSEQFLSLGWSNEYDGFEGPTGYFAARANGIDTDSPARPIPHDGTYTWDTILGPVRGNYCKIRYTEGAGDRAWMEERDRNYLARLASGDIRNEEEQRDANPWFWTRLFNSSWGKAHAEVEKSLEETMAARKKQAYFSCLEKLWISMGGEPTKIPDMKRALFGDYAAYYDEINELWEINQEDDEGGWRLLELLFSRYRGYRGMKKIAQRKYRVARENGTVKDNPAYEFPGDGTYTWSKSDVDAFSAIKVRYLEGQKDAAWMAEKDRNFVTRLLEPVQLQLAIQLSLLESDGLEEPRELFSLQVYDVHYAPGDCLFDAVATFDTVGRNGVAMRTLAIEQIRRDEQLQERILELVGIAEHRLQVTVGNGTFVNVDNYLRLMGLPQTWGTEIELVALARALRRPIVVLTPGNRGDIIFEGPGYDVAHPVFLNYVYGNHYTPLMITDGHNAPEILSAIRQRIATRRVAVAPLESSSGVARHEGVKEKSEIAEELLRVEREKIDTERVRPVEKSQTDEEREAAEKVAIEKREKEHYLKMAAESSDMPPSFRCSITGEAMRDPVIAADGHSYEREAIKLWLREHYTSPLTGLKLVHRKLVPNWELKKSIDEWLEIKARQLATADSERMAPASSVAAPQPSSSSELALVSSGLSAAMASYGHFAARPDSHQKIDADEKTSDGTMKKSQ